MSPFSSRRVVAALPIAAAVIAAVVVVVVVIVGGGVSPHEAGPAPVTPPASRSAPNAAPSVAGEEFGASVNLLFNAGGVTAAQRDAQLNALHTTGATLARTDALWERSEPFPPAGGIHRYSWTFDDQVALALAAHDLRWLPIVDYSAGWAQSIQGQDHSPPSSSSDYAAYAAALAARYGPHGSFWRIHPELPALPVEAFEIWNEPDSPAFWAPHPDPARYAELYAHARDAIQRVDPTARVLVGGLASAPVFLPQIVAADPELRGTINGVAIHPYAASPAGVLANARDARRALQMLGLATVPLYVTEFGWTTSPPGALDFLAAGLRPGYIERTLLELGTSGCKIAAIILYTWFSPDRDPRNSQDWFGISPPGAGGSAAVTAFAAGLREAERARSGQSCR